MLFAFSIDLFYLAFFVLQQYMLLYAGYLYNFQTKEFYDLSYGHEPATAPRFGGLLNYQYLWRITTLFS